MTGLCIHSGMETLYVCTYVCILCALHSCFHVVLVIQAAVEEMDDDDT